MSTGRLARRVAFVPLPSGASRARGCPRPPDGRRGQRRRDPGPAASAGRAAPRSRPSRFTWPDRALVALLAGLVPTERWAAFLVAPKTILAWHRALGRRRWTYPHGRPGRPSLPDDTVELIPRLAREIRKVRKNEVSVQLRPALRTTRLGQRVRACRRTKSVRSRSCASELGPALLLFACRTGASEANVA